MKATYRLALILLVLALAACNTGGPRRPAGPFLKPPLKAGEKFSYKLTTSSGVVGKAVFRVAKDKKSPGGFILTNTGSIPSMLDSVAVSRVRPDMRPISTDVKIKNPGGVFEMTAVYRGDTLAIEAPGQPARTITIAEPTYDFGEFLMLLRSLDFRVGAAYTVNEAWPSFGQVFQSRIEVTGVKNIAVPAGDFRAYHVTHTFGDEAGGRPQTVYHSWYEQDPPHRLIRHNSGSVLYELMPVGKQ